MDMAGYKKILFMMLAMLFAQAFAQTVSSQFGTINGLTISNATFYSPYPAEPGSYIDLYVRVQYTGFQGSLQNVTCYINQSYPFSIDPGDAYSSYIGALTPFQEVLLKYHVRIDENAVQGDNDIKYVCDVQGFPPAETDLPIFVQSQQAILQVGDVQSDPSTFNPGQAGKVIVQLDNLAAITLKDVMVTLDLSDQNTPFAPINGTTEKSIGSIISESNGTVEFNVVALPNAAPGVYKVPIEVTYFDSLGKNYSDSVLTSMLVTTAPEIQMVQESTGTVKNGTDNQITVSIINSGLSQVKSMVATVGHSASGEYTVLTPSVVYVGDISADDSQTAEYDVYVNTSKSQIVLPMTVTFVDALGNTYTESGDVSVNVFNDQQAVQFGIEQAVPIDPIVIGIAALILLYVLYRLYKQITGKKRQ